VRCLCNRLEARAYAHATEDLDKVLRAVRNLVDGSLVITRLKGHYGNEIDVVTAEVRGCEATKALAYILKMLDELDFNIFINSLTIHKNKIYIRINKQSAFLNIIRLGEGDDVILIEASVSVKDANELIAMLRDLRGGPRTAEGGGRQNRGPSG
jgi:RNA binding exosome subunit